MALEGIHIIVHNSNGISNMDASSAIGTFQDVLNVLKTGQLSNGVSLYSGNIYGTGQEIGLSLTEGGTPLTLSSLITSEFQDGTTGTLYALYPEPQAETITGFFLDGTEYQFAGGGGGGGGHDYSWETKTITSGAVELGLRTIVEPTSNFTLNAPSDLQDGMEYVLRCVNGSTAYTLTLGTGFVNDFSTDLTLHANHSDQFTFVAVDGSLELQPEYVVDSGSGAASFTKGTMVDAGDTYGYFTVQGPCSDGFHVPTKGEFQQLLTVYSTLTNSSGANGIRTYLKMPYNRCRRYDSGDPAGVNGQYWTCTHSDSSNKAYYFYMPESGTSVVQEAGTTRGYGIRPFKNGVSVPTSSWTILYDGSSVATGAGIFHDATEGVISISADGTNWITIADKNCGATTVYNSGDTTSEANCGKFYQWGNKYGFARSGTITTSSSKTSASSYGPSVYSRGTFVKQSSNPSSWDSSDNKNLWGGVTGVIVSQGITFKVLSCPDQLKGVNLSETYFGPGTASFSSPETVSGIVAVEVHAAKVAAINGCNGPSTTRRQCGNIYAFNVSQHTLRGGYAALKLTSSAGVVRYLCRKVHGND